MKILSLIALIVLSVLLIFFDYSGLVKFFLVVWLISVTRKIFIKEKHITDFDISKIKIYNPTDFKDLDDLLEEINRDGYRPAELDEAVLWFDKNKDRKDFRKIIPLGSLDISKGMNMVPVIDISVGTFSSYLENIFFSSRFFDVEDDEYERGVIFLAVSK